MSDDPILAALARLDATVAGMDIRLAGVEARLGGVEARLAGVEARLGGVEAEQTRLRTQINTKLDDILDQLKAVREDCDNTRGHVLYGLQENLTLSQRITKLEEEMRRR